MFRAALAALSLAAPAAAGDLTLGFPVDCQPGTTCHIQNYVDRDPGPGIADYRCGTLSYDDHDGTDIALPTLAQMMAGVNVLAAAPGEVAARRDGEVDRFYTPESAAGIDGRECGNGVLIRHADGWETQYCHMKLGSITVSPGDHVAQGAVLGQVGLSGMTEFPHLHLSVRHNGTAVDPFDRDATESCAEGDAHIWQVEPSYAPGGLVDAGFAAGLPTYDDIRAGTAAATGLGTDAAGLVIFGLGYGLQQGDVLTLTISGPEGEVIRTPITLDKDQAQAYRAAGKKRPAGGWPAGRYLGTVTLTRDGTSLGELTREISLR
ncbi:M23 family metallopeptidase [Seohaeicola nanhaiensis]|uniref:M23 family metallopeptidase n=1 Tax=Seohaeicola nanhaiensis TaxID=1387282 RepID=A0ABV9KNA2_9RHOB